jgi:tetratricopeptide (TPR) repeat protein
MFNARRIILCTIALAALASGAAPGRAGDYGTELPFTAGTGARTSGLGVAGVSLIESPTLMYFNAAVLRRYDRKAFEFYRTTFFDSDAQYLTLSYVHPTLDMGTFGVSILRLGVDGIEQRDINNNLLGSVDDGQTRVLLGYGLNVHPLLAVGFNAKIDNHSFGGYSGTGFGFDLGLHALKEISDTGFVRDVRAGLAVENLIEPKIQLDEEDVADPLRTSLGASLVAGYDDFGFTTALDVVYPRFSPAQVRFGQEIDYLKFFALRFGMQGSTPTFGLGGQYRGVALDYAYRSEDLGSNHRISLTVAFGKSTSERSEERRAQIDAELQSRVAERLYEFEQTQLIDLTTAADGLFDAGDYPGALTQYDAVLLWDPENEHAAARHHECRFRIEISEGRSLFAGEDYVAALYRFRRALQLDPDDVEAAELVAECQRKIEEDSDRALMIDQMVRSAIDLYAEGRYSEAQAAFEEILRIDPKNQLAYEYEHKSRTNVQNAVQGLILRARAQADRGQYGSAIATLQQALEFAPDNEQIRSEILILSQRESRAQEELTSAPATQTTLRQPDPVPANRAALDAKYEQGLRYFEDGEFERATRELLEVWTVAPTYRNVSDPLTRAYLFLGMKVYSDERYDDAIRIWEKILAIDPGNSKAQRYLQKTREEASRLTEGVR